MLHAMKIAFKFPVEKGNLTHLIDTTTGSIEVIRLAMHAAPPRGKHGATRGARASALKTIRGNTPSG